MATAMVTIRTEATQMLFPNDSSEWFDSDGDGVGDNADEFKFDGSQSADADNDGYGDNPNGTNGDHCKRRSPLVGP